MEIIDISIKLDENTPVYTGDPRFQKEIWRSVERDTYMLSKIRMGTHTGTHVDAPCHYFESERSVYDLPLRKFVGNCAVLNSFEDYCGQSRRILLKGKNTKLTVAQAQKLVDNRVMLIGTESASIGDDEVHKILLGSECIILEWLLLDKAPVGKYFLSAAPLKIDTDGSPVRAYLIRGLNEGEQD